MNIEQQTFKRVIRARRRREARLRRNLDPSWIKARLHRNRAVNYAKPVVREQAVKIS